jgi:hypothetical protein
MQLLDRYLTAVKFWLPKKQRNDIAADYRTDYKSARTDHSLSIVRHFAADFD